MNKNKSKSKNPLQNKNRLPEIRLTVDYWSNGMLTPQTDIYHRKGTVCFNEFSLGDFIHIEAMSTKSLFISIGDNEFFAEYDSKLDKWKVIPYV